MEYEILENGQVLKVERAGGTVIKTHYCMLKKIALNQVPGGVQVQVRDWQGQLLPLEPVQVEISGAGIETVETVCADGLVELEGLTGVNVLIRASVPGYDSAEMVVTL